MKPGLIILLTFITFLAVLVSIESYRRRSKKSTTLVTNTRAPREISKSIGIAANGAYILAPMDLVAAQFVYKLSVTNDGCFRTQVDFAKTAGSTTYGPIGSITGDVGVGSAAPTSAPFAPGSGYTAGKYNNVTLTNVSGSMKGSGALAFVDVNGNGTVKAVTISNAGLGYSVNDILQPCFTFTDSNGVQAPGCTGTGQGCQVKVVSVKRTTVQNPHLSDPVWASSTTVRDIGPGAVFAANEVQNSVNITYMGPKFAGYYPGLCSLGDVPNNAQTQWFCLMDEFMVVKDSATRNSMRFATMIVLAQTSEHDDFRVYYLLHTCTGLGILAAPRGSQITVDLFAAGYTDLFTELGHPRCGQLASDLPSNGLPALGLSYFYNYVCGMGCATEVPSSANPYDVLLWELASPDGKYRLQFFDSGHFRFISVANTGPIANISITNGGKKYTGPSTNVHLIDSNGAWLGATVNITLTDGVVTGVNLINYGSGYRIGDKLTLANSTIKFEVYRTKSELDPTFFETLRLGADLDSPPTNVTYPLCTESPPLVTLSPTKQLEIRRDCWILRGATYYKDADGTLTSISNCDLMVQITDGGSLVLEKNYTYGTSVPPNHTMVQSAIGKLLTNDPLTQNVGAPSNDAPKNKHWSLGNSLACYGGPSSLEGGNFDLAQGTVLAQTDTFQNSSNVTSSGRYILWLSHYGLRLLFANAPSATLLQDMTQCMWITPFYYQWWYYGGDSTKNAFTKASVCRENGYPRWPIPNKQYNEAGAAHPGNPCLDTCGTFPKPSHATPNGEAEVPILVLSSKNKRYMFRMMNSGRCMLLDTNPSSTTPLWSSDNYQQVTAVWVSGVNQCVC